MLHRDRGGHPKGQRLKLSNSPNFFEFLKKLQKKERRYRGKTSRKKHFFRKNTRAEFDPNFDFPYFQND